MLGMMPFSWYTMEMPFRAASFGSLGKGTATPLCSHSPRSGVWMPTRIFMRVVLPAPFSPTTPTISFG
jgi:hypothetical protein